jgi:hypothetical protein
MEPVYVVYDQCNSEDEGLFINELVDVFSTEELAQKAVKKLNETYPHSPHDYSEFLLNDTFRLKDYIEA